MDLIEKLGGVLTSPSQDRGGPSRVTIHELREVIDLPKRLDEEVSDHRVNRIMI